MLLNEKVDPDEKLFKESFVNTKYFFPEKLPNYFQNANIIKVGLSPSKNNVLFAWLKTL